MALHDTLYEFVFQTHLGLILLASVVLYPPAHVIYQRFFSPLAKVPGPFWASISRLWLASRSYKGNMHTEMMRVHAKYGRTVRTGPNEISFSDGNSIKTVYSAGAKFPKSDWYMPFQGDRVFDIFPERNDSVHAMHRRLVSNVFSMSSLRDLELYVDRSIAVFMEKIQGFEGKPFDLGVWTQLFAFDIVGEVLFSHRFGFMDDGHGDGIFDRIRGILGSAAWTGQMPWVYRLNKLITPIVGSLLKVTSRNVYIFQYTAAQVKKRLGSGGDDKDILSRLKAVHEKKPEQFPQEFVIAMSSSAIGAGSDTTATSLRGIFYYLLKDQRVYKKLMDELTTARAEGRISDPITFQEAEHLPYLQAVMWEGIRLNPAVGHNLPRVTPAGGATLDGYTIPAGTIVGANAWVVHRQEDLFGDDAKEYRPERWTEEGGAHLQRYNLAFGGQNRFCIGKNISWMEMSKMIPTLLMKYHLEFENDHPTLEGVTWFVMFQHMTPVIVTRREKA